MLTDLQKRKLTSLFYWYDADDNGNLRLDDFERLVQNISEIRGRGPGSQEYSQLYTRFMFDWSALLASADKSGDNAISLDEWLAHMDTILQIDEATERTINSLTELIWSLTDIDGSGRISPQEYALFLKAYNVDERIRDTIFRQLDLNGDGHLTREEIAKLVREFYLSNDPNAPGNWLIGPF